MKLNFIPIITAAAIFLGTSVGLCAADYEMPFEEEEHEGTWLQWPHNNGWDPNHIQRYEETWIQMTEALHTGERVHIIVWNWRQRHVNGLSSIPNRWGRSCGRIGMILKTSIRPRVTLGS